MTSDLSDKYLQNTIKSKITQPEADGKNVRGFESTNTNDIGDSTHTCQTPSWATNAESIVGKGPGPELSS